MKSQYLLTLEQPLYKFYSNTGVPVWVYDEYNELHFVNTTSSTLLHLMDIVRPLARRHAIDGITLGHHFITDNPYELYFSFTYAPTKWHSYTIVAGPVFLVKPQASYWEHLSFNKVIWSNQKSEILNLIPVFPCDAFLAQMEELMRIFQIPTPDFSMYLRNYTPKTTSDNYSELYCSCSCQKPEISPSQIFDCTSLLFCYIKNGNPHKLCSFMEQEQTRDILFPVKTLKGCKRSAQEYLILGKYACIEGGFSADKAFALYDTYSDSIMDATGFSECIDICMNALFTFAMNTHQFANFMQPEYSPVVNECIRIILSHVPDKISLEEIAAEVHLSPKYLSALFCRETGHTFTDFKQEVCVHEAKNLLANTNLSYSEISSMLNFSSQSYFNSIFKSKTGVTPKEYRHDARPACNCNESHTKENKKLASK